MNSIPLPEDIAHEDSVFAAELSSVNYEIARYLVRMMDDDAGRTPSLSVEGERALATRITRVGQSMQARADQRELTEIPDLCRSRKSCGEQR